MEGSNDIERGKGEVNHECPKCGAEFHDDCLKDQEEKLIIMVKAWILAYAGTGLVTVVHGVLAYHAFEVAHARPGLGIDLNQLINGAAICVAAIVYWAFPKDGKK